MPQTGGSPARPVTTGLGNGTSPAGSSPAGSGTTGVETGTKSAGSTSAGPVTAGLKPELEGDSNSLSVLDVPKLQRNRLGIPRNLA